MRQAHSRPLLALAILCSPVVGCLTTSTPEDPGGPDYPDFDPREGDAMQVVQDAGPGASRQDGSSSFGSEAGGGVVGGGIVGGAPDGSVARDASVADAGSGDASTPDASSDTGGGSALASCMINATTEAYDSFSYFGKYGCAVWVGDNSKKVVKAFFVATRIANRTGLPTYRTASSGVTVDVVTGATVNQTIQHRYTWSVPGSPLPSGNYTLNVETHSSSGINLVSVPFATNNGAVNAMGNPKGDVKAAGISCN